MTNKEKIKYYIIKDLDTGLYYRGKGQNRWGKYYNQASIFRNLAQAHNSVEELKRYYKSNAVAIEIEINEQTNTSFEECIKEWEDRGYETIYRENYIIFRHHRTYKSIAIYLIDLSYISYEWYDAKRPIADRLNVDEAQSITLELHNLIHKTLKAVKMENDS